MMALSRVPGDDALFVGGAFTLRRPTALEKCNITHVVSVLNGNLEEVKQLRSSIQWLQIDVYDYDDEDLLSHFNEAIGFIENALKSGGGVLVHCAMGKSRSVTVVIAYLLATRPELTPASALALVQESRPLAEPNDGFMEQLELFHSMGCPRDVPSKRAYQKWLFDREVKLSIEAGRAPEVLRFEDEQTGDAQETPSPTDDMELRCRKCRRTLVTGPFIHDHVPSERPAGSTQPTCTQHYIDPLSWMRDELSLGQLSGRLECPNARCGNSVGRYAWQGMRCGCGAWVCPAITLQKSRVDEIHRRADLRFAKDGIRLPPGMASLGDAPSAASPAHSVAAEKGNL